MQHRACMVYKAWHIAILPLTGKACQFLIFIMRKKDKLITFKNNKKWYLFHYIDTPLEENMNQSSTSPQC